MTLRLSRKLAERQDSQTVECRSEIKERGTQPGMCSLPTAASPVKLGGGHGGLCALPFDSRAESNLTNTATTSLLPLW